MGNLITFSSSERGHHQQPEPLWSHPADGGIEVQQRGDHQVPAEEGRQD